MKLFAVGILLIFLLAIGPLLTIWSLNTLFPALAIPYGFDTWAAIIILAATIKYNVKVEK